MKVLLTGGNGDIGMAITNHLLSQNHKVVAIDKSLTNLEKINNKHLTLVDCDFSQPENTDKLKFIKPFDVFIHAAGIRNIKPFGTLSWKDWQNHFDVNVNTAFLLSRKLIEVSVLQEKPLSIIFISSISGLYGESFRSAYCASKHALNGLAKSLALEYGPYNVRVNIIAPGIIETEMTKDYKSDPNTLNQINNHTPLKKWGQPHHIAQCVDIMIHNDYLTGTTLVIDGGWTAGKEISV